MATIVRASSTETAIGFSATTWHPASIAAPAYSTLRPGGVQRWTMSTVLSNAVMPSTATEPLVLLRQALEEPLIDEHDAPANK